MDDLKEKKRNYAGDKSRSTFNSIVDGLKHVHIDNQTSN